METAIALGSSRPELGRAVAREAGLPVLDLRLARFPDGELDVELRDPVRDMEVVVLQSTHAPVGARLLELLLVCDAARRAGAARVSAVVPYFGYARQDRRRHEGRPHGAQTVARALGAAQLDRLLTVDLHSPAVEGCLPMPVDHLSAVPHLARAAAPFVPEEAVVVAPDLGAVKLAEAYARALDRPMAVILKHRLSGSDVEVRGVVGEVRGRHPVLVDDMIATGGTLTAAADALLRAGCEPDFLVVATHGLFVGRAFQRMGSLPLRRCLVTDSVPQPPAPPWPHQVVSLAPLLAGALRRIADGASLEALLCTR